MLARKESQIFSRFNLINADTLILWQLLSVRINGGSDYIIIHSLNFSIFDQPHLFKVGNIIRWIEIMQLFHIRRLSMIVRVYIALNSTVIVGIGYNGAETNCGIACILGILLMNSCDT